MLESLVYDAVCNAIEVALLVGAPVLLGALAVGVFVSVIQAVTQIQEQTLTFVPKLAAIAVLILLMLPWFLRQLTNFLVESIQLIPAVMQ